MRAKALHGPSWPGRVLVDHEDVGDAFALETVAEGDARLPAADDKDIEHGFAAGRVVGFKPHLVRVVEHLQVVANARFELCDGGGVDDEVARHTTIEGGGHVEFADHDGSVTKLSTAKECIDGCFFV
jgi:hypothetical protein